MHNGRVKRCSSSLLSRVLPVRKSSRFLSCSVLIPFQNHSPFVSPVPYRRGPSMPLFSAIRSPSFEGTMFSFSHLRQRGQADLNGDTKKAQRRNGELPCDDHAPTSRLSTHRFGEVINA